MSNKQTAVKSADAGKTDTGKAGKPQHLVKSATRLYAIQALFQLEASKQSLQEVAQQFHQHRFGATIEDAIYSKANTALFDEILACAVKNQSRIDQITDTALVEKWPLAQIDPTLRAVFRAAGAELLVGKTPVKAVINEYLDICKAFFPDGRESQFANGILDTIARAARPEFFNG